MVNTEKLQAYYKTAEDEKAVAEEAKKTGKPVSEILAAKAAAAEKAEQKQQQEETKQATIAEQKQK